MKKRIFYIICFALITAFSIHTIQANDIAPTPRASYEVAKSYKGKVSIPTDKGLCNVKYEYTAYIRFDINTGLKTSWGVRDTANLHAECANHFLGVSQVDVTFEKINDYSYRGRPTVLHFTITGDYLGSYALTPIIINSQGPRMIDL